VLVMYVQHAGLVIFGDASYVTICLLVFIVLDKKKLLLGMVWYSSPPILRCDEHC